MNQFKKQWHRILSLLVVATIILSGVPVTTVSAAETATAGVTSADATSADNSAIGISGEIEADNAEPADTDQEEPEPDPVDEGDGSVATSGVTVNNDDESCACTAFQSDPDCPVCKDDATQCFYYYCVCEALCGEDDINHDCPICADDYTSCVMAVDVPELAAMTAHTSIITDTMLADGDTVSGTIGQTGLTITVTVPTGATVTVTGQITINGNVTITGGGTLKRDAGYKSVLFLVSIDTPASLTLNDITIDGNNGVVTDAGSSPIYVNSDGTLTMNNGATLRNNTIKSEGGGVYNQGTFNMNGTASISDNTTTKDGGGVYNKGIFNMSDTASISGNTAAGNGGGVFNHSFGTFNMSSTASISGNKAKNGGGLYNAQGTFNMTGGTISNNTAEINGGGVDSRTGDGEVNISGGTISGNTAETGDGGGLNIWDSFDMSGSPIIENNIKGAGGVANTGGVCLIGTQTIWIDAPGLSAGAIIGIEDSDTTVARNAEEGDEGYFYISNADSEIDGMSVFAFDSDNSEIRLVSTQVYVASTGSDSNAGTEASPFATIAKAYSVVPSGGEIFVMDEIEMSPTPLSVASGTKTITLKSASGTQIIKRGTTGSLFTVDSGVTLILENIIIDGNNGIEPYKTDCVGTLVYVKTGGALTMKTGATLQNNTQFSSDGGGGVVSIGTVTMNGGTISGNIADSGAGVYNFGIFNMSGGIISGNTAKYGSGGMHNGYNRTFNMSGGTISDNTAMWGGGVNNDGTFTMTSGTISGNMAIQGVDAYGSYGGDGGGVYNSDGTFTMTVGEISGNTAKIVGGGVYNSSTFTVGGAAKVKGNTKSGAPATPNNVYLYVDEAYPEDNTYITLGTGGNAPASGMEIYVQGASGDTIVDTGAVATDAQYFKADNSALAVVHEGGKLKLGVPLTPVTNTGGSATVTYAGTTIDLTTLTSLFTVDANAGARTYTVDSTSNNGAGTIGGDNKTLTVTSAGTFTIGLTTAATATYAAGAKVTATLTVNKGALTPTISFSGVSGKTYDGTAAISGKQPTIILSGTTGGDAPAATAIFAFANANAGTNKPVNAASITLSGTWGDLYTLSAAALSNVASGLAITAKAVTVTPDAGQSKTYGSADPTLTYTPSEALLAGNAFSGALSRASGENVGTYAIALGTLSAGSNYTLSLSATPVNFTINKATYTGTTTATATVRAGKTTTNATLTLPILPAGASYLSNGTVGGTIALIGSHSISFGTLKYSATSQSDGTSATITIPVTNATNYNSYNVVVTITAQDPTAAEKVADDLDALTFNDIKNQNVTERDISSDLTLITTGKVYSSTITWVSSNASIIGTNGTVSKPTDSDKTVTLTATVTNGSASGTKTFTLTVKKAPASTGGVDGEVEDSGGTARDGYTVKIMTGGTNGTLIGATTTSGGGKYSFSGLPYGVYSLVVDDGTNTVTRLITINKPSFTEPVIKMPSGYQNTHVEVNGSDTPSVAVENLEEVFTPGDITAAQTGSVEIKLVVEAVTNPADANIVLQNIGGKELGFYLDAKLIKTVSGNNSGSGTADGTYDIQPPSGTKLTIVIDVPPELQNMAPYSIIRVHTDGNGVTTVKTITPIHDSTLHTLTFDADLFSTYALAYTPKTPNPPPSPSSGGGSSSSGGGGGGTGSPVVSTYWIEVAEAKTMAKAAKEQGADIARSRRSTITGIRKASLLLLSKSGLRYQHDTVFGNAVQVRVYVDDPAKAVKDILVSGYVTGDTVDKTKSIINKWFPNKIAVVSFDAQGNFGMKVEVAAKVDLSGMETNNLYFYSYDKKTNKYNCIQTEYRIDANGYLHFVTILAGDIIVSSGPLTKKTEQQIAVDGNKYNYLAMRSIHEITNKTGGDSLLDVSEPPMQETPQNPSTEGDSLLYVNPADTPLKLKKVDNQSSGGALVIDLDAPLAQDVTGDTHKEAATQTYCLIGGIMAVLLFAAVVLWAAIPCKDDKLVSDEEYREKH